MDTLEFNAKKKLFSKDIEGYQAEIVSLEKELLEEIKDASNDDFLNDKCSICLEQFYKLTDNIVSLSCGCCYCKECISTCNKGNCPICSKPFTKGSINVNRVMRDMFKNDKRVQLHKKLVELRNKIKEFDLDPNLDVSSENKLKLRQDIGKYFMDRYPNINVRNEILKIFKANKVLAKVEASKINE